MPATITVLEVPAPRERPREEMGEEGGRGRGGDATKEYESKKPKQEREGVTGEQTLLPHRTPQLRAQLPVS